MSSNSCSSSNAAAKDHPWGVNNNNNNNNTTPRSSSMVVATRLHLGNATSPPTQETMDATVRQFLEFSTTSCQAASAVIAVDASPQMLVKFPNYNLTNSVQTAAERATKSILAAQSHTETAFCCPLRVLPVSPWGNFIPALNALVVDICHTNNNNNNNNQGRATNWTCLFASAETQASAASVQVLYEAVFDSYDTTLVAGALLPGHDYQGPTPTSRTTTTTNTNTNSKKVALNGRTTPWNTLALWNLEKLALTGFPLVGDGLHPPTPTAATTLGLGGVEEVSCIALLQRLLGEEQAVAKLLPLPDVTWEQDFSGDDERKAWHDVKMKSKVERPARHLQVLGLSGSGWVHHYL